MNYNLEGKTVLITGATSGFGLAIAQQAAKAGARLVLCGRRQERLAKLTHELGTEIYTATLDIRDASSVQIFADTLPDKFSAIDVLVNNAGLALGLNSADEADLKQWEQMVDTNIKGLMYCTRAILPKMVARNSGHIVNMGSIAGEYPYPGGNVYGGTKGFVRQFSLNLRADLLGKNVRVTLIEPGMAETEFSLVRFSGDKTKADNVYKGIHALSADDVADSVMWAITRPSHVNVNRLEIMPIMQAFSGFAVHRKG